MSLRHGRTTVGIRGPPGFKGRSWTRPQALYRYRHQDAEQFNATKDSPVEDFVAEADRHPVFELIVLNADAS